MVTSSPSCQPGEELRTRDFSRASEAERDEAARKIVTLCSYAVGVVAISPRPRS